MHSMTGYGSGRSATGGAQCSVEIQSVNRRQSELAINLPRELVCLDSRVREIINARIARGRLSINIVCQKRATPDAAATAPALDAALARVYHQAMLALQQELGLGGEISIETILRAPGVLRLNEEDPPAPEQVWPQIESALGQALAGLIEMRAAEGARLADDLLARLEMIGSLLGEIRVRQPLIAQNYRQSLQDRLARAKLDLPIDEDRLAKEVAVFAERCDISEEITRLESHLDQFRSLIYKKDEPVGRALDFLSQEMARELNTLGAKSNDLSINQATLTCKAELDKIREQVQNIE